jgi:transketolase
MDAVQKANSGHPGTPLALAPVPLYSGTAIFTPEQVAMIKE